MRTPKFRRQTVMESRFNIPLIESRSSQKGPNGSVGSSKAPAELTKRMIDGADRTAASTVVAIAQVRGRSANDRVEGR